MDRVLNSAVTQWTMCLKFQHPRQDCLGCVINAGDILNSIRVWNVRDENSCFFCKNPDAIPSNTPTSLLTFASSFTTNICDGLITVIKSYKRNLLQRSLYNGFWLRNFQQIEDCTALTHAYYASSVLLQGQTSILSAECFANRLIRNCAPISE